MVRARGLRVASCFPRMPQQYEEVRRRGTYGRRCKVTSKVTINLRKRSPIGALAAGAAAAGVLIIGVLEILTLAVKKGRIQRLDIEELEVGRLHVRELVVEQEQRPASDAP